MSKLTTIRRQMQNAIFIIRNRKKILKKEKNNFFVEEKKNSSPWLGNSDGEGYPEEGESKAKTPVSMHACSEGEGNLYNNDPTLFHINTCKQKRPDIKMDASFFFPVHRKFVYIMPLPPMFVCTP